MSPAENNGTAPRRLTPERLAELRAAGQVTDAERRRVQAVCVHPGTRRLKLGWGVVCDMCKAILG